MPLIPYVDPESVREMIARAPVVLNVLRMIANSEAVVRPFSQLGNALLTRAKLDPKLREIAILRNAKLCRSVYEWTQHAPIAKATGVTEEQVAAMEDWEPARCFSQLERLVLRFTDEVALQVKGRRETRAVLAATLAPAELVELIVSIGFWGMVARLLETSEVELEPFAGKVNLMRRPVRGSGEG